MLRYASRHLQVITRAVKRYDRGECRALPQASTGDQNVAKHVATRGARTCSILDDTKLPLPARSGPMSSSRGARAGHAVTRAAHGDDTPSAGAVMRLPLLARAPPHAVLKRNAAFESARGWFCVLQGGRQSLCATPGRLSAHAQRLVCCSRVLASTHRPF